MTANALYQMIATARRAGGVTGQPASVSVTTSATPGWTGRGGGRPDGAERLVLPGRCCAGTARSARGVRARRTTTASWAAACDPERASKRPSVAESGHMLEGCCAAAAPLTEVIRWRYPPRGAVHDADAGVVDASRQVGSPPIAARLMCLARPDAPRSASTRPAPACARRSGCFSGRRSGPRHWNPQPRRSGLRGRAGVGEDGVDLPALTSWAGDQTLPCTAWQQVVFSCTSEAVLLEQGRLVAAAPWAESSTSTPRWSMRVARRPRLSARRA